MKTGTFAIILSIFISSTICGQKISEWRPENRTGVSAEKGLLKSWLVRATPDKFDLVSSFKVTLGETGPFWAHPVIHKGILYLRHMNALMAYNIKSRS